MHHKLFSVRLSQPLGGERIAVGILSAKAFCISPLICFHLFIGGQHNGRKALIKAIRLKYRTVNVGDILHIQAGIQGIGNLHNASLTHTVHQQIRLRIQQNRPLQAFRPVIIVGKPPQAGLDTTNENRHILVNLPNQIAIYHRGIIRALAHHTTGSKGIVLPFVLGDGVMIDHRIHIAAGYQKAQPGLAQYVNRLGILPIRLGDDTHGIPGIFQHTADNGVTEGGVVYIGIGNDIHKVALLPAPGDHILFGNGQKFHSVLLKSFLLV